MRNRFIVSIEPTLAIWHEVKQEFKRYPFYSIGLLIALITVIAPVTFFAIFLFGSRKAIKKALPVVEHSRMERICYPVYLRHHGYRHKVTKTELVN